MTGEKDCSIGIGGEMTVMGDNASREEERRKRDRRGQGL